MMESEEREEGKTIFLRECMVCHNDTGTGAGAYSDGLQPPPDFHDPSTYSSFADAGYFWRIAEGVPWTSMPAWKMQYGDTDRWKLVHYIRVLFTQTEPRPPVQSAHVYPETYTSQLLPSSGIPYDEDRTTYVQQCAKCHGLSGEGNGWLGQWLTPPPASPPGLAGQTPFPPAPSPAPLGGGAPAAVPTTMSGGPPESPVPSQWRARGRRGCRWRALQGIAPDALPAPMCGRLVWRG